MKKPKILRVVLPVILGCVIAAFLYAHFHNPVNNTDTLGIYGNVDIRQIQVAFQATGRIKDLLVQEGDVVAAGQLLAKMDPVRYEAAVKQARGQVSAQKELVARLEAGSRPEEIESARASVRAAEAALTNAELVYRRTKELTLTKTVSQQNLDTADANYKLAKAKLEEARQGLALAVKGPRQEDIRAALAQLDVYEATLGLSEQKLADTELHAPAAGVIQNRILEPGDMASSQTPVCTLALNDPVWVRAYVSETDLGRIFQGMRAQVTTDSFPDKVYEGWIGFISPTAEFTPKQIETAELRSRLVYQVRVYVCNPQNELRLGMPVSVHLPLNQTQDSKTKKGSNPCDPEA